MWDVSGLLVPRKSKEMFDRRRTRNCRDMECYSGHDREVEEGKYCGAPPSDKLQPDRDLRVSRGLHKP